MVKADTTFMTMSRLQQLIPSVNAIKIEAFYEIISLLKLTIPSTIKIVEKQAFWGCINLKELIIHDDHNGLTEIQNHAFRQCESLINVHLPVVSYKLERGRFTVARLL